MNTRLASLPDRLLLGANAFQGTNHFLKERGRARETDLAAPRIRAVLSAAVSSGATGFTFTADDEMYSTLGGWSGEPSSRAVNLYVIYPNSKLISRLIARGTSGMLSEAMDGLRFSTRARMVVKGAWSFLLKDPYSALSTYLELETERLRVTVSPHFRLQSILLNELLTDSIMSVGAVEVFRVFLKTTTDRLGVTPGFVTRNLPMFIKFCKSKEIRLDKIAVMTPLNPLGFQMTPDRETVEAVLRQEGELKVIGISLLAGGQVSLREALEYLSKQRLVNALAVGASTTDQARQTFTQLRELNARLP